MQSDLPLLIMADIPPTFRLADLSVSGKMSEGISLTPSQYQSRDRLEVMTGGMGFELIHYSAEEISQNLSIADLEHIFCEAPEKRLAGIGIKPGKDIGAARHSDTVNRALLKLARYVGQSVNARTIVWRPAGLHVGFDYFVGSTDHYISGGPFPVLSQIAISETAKGEFETSGLSYFSGQEIRITSPDGYEPNEVVKRLVRIAHDIATNGKIEKKIETDGFVRGEKLLITPQTDGSMVEVAIVADKPQQLH